jgi:hypothetical protein
MTKLQKDELRKSFRPTLRVKSIAKMSKEDPNNIYKEVRYDDRMDPNGERIDRYLEKGWEIVSSDEHLQDDRSNAPKSKEDNKLRPSPSVRSGKGGAQFVLMRKSKEQFQSDEASKVKRYEDRYFRSSSKKVTRDGENVNVTLHEVNENNLNRNNSEENDNA